MGTKRYDSKHRLLKDGEYQNKDGSYSFKFINNSGKRSTVTSWRLLETDKTPIGKKQKAPLRELEKEVLRNLGLGTLTSCDVSVRELVNEYVNLKKNKVRASTYNKYITISKILLQDSYKSFGELKITKVKPLTAKKFLISLKERYSYGYVKNVVFLLKASFQMGIENDLLIKNPFSFRLDTVIANDKKEKVILSDTQIKELFNFIKSDKHFSQYYEAWYILLRTGLRVSEFCGLTIDDVDLKNNLLKVTKQLRRINSHFVVCPPKSDAGIRCVPFNDETRKCFEILINRRRKQKIETLIDGTGNFLIVDKNGMPLYNSKWSSVLKNIITKYNKTHDVELPKITPHTFRHQFATKCSDCGMSINATQFIIGHSDVSTLLNIYTHSTIENVQREFLAKMG